MHMRYSVDLKKKKKTVMSNKKYNSKQNINNISNG